LLIFRPEGGHTTTYADATEAFNFVLSKAEIKRRSAKPTGS
jgi:hypothetical protein